MYEKIMDHKDHPIQSCTLDPILNFCLRYIPASLEPPLHERSPWFGVRSLICMYCSVLGKGGDVHAPLTNCKIYREVHASALFGVALDAGW